MTGFGGLWPDLPNPTDIVARLRENGRDGIGEEAACIIERLRETVSDLVAVQRAHHLQVTGLDAEVISTDEMGRAEPRVLPTGRATVTATNGATVVSWRVVDADAWNLGDPVNVTIERADPQ